MAVSFQVCAACLLVAQTSLPALPRLALDSYSPAARDAISRAYQDATARSTDPVAVGTLARTLHAWEQWSAAHDAYARAQALAPRAFEWVYLDALVLQRLARYADAASRLEQALRLSSDYLPARVALAESLLESGDLAGAITAHEAALARDPSIAQAHANLISLYGRTQNWAKAEEHYRALVALGSNLGDAHYDYGVLLGLQEKWDLAAEAYRKAIGVNPRHARAHNNLGEI